MTTHNTHSRQTSMPPAGFEPAVPASGRPQPHALADWFAASQEIPAFYGTRRFITALTSLRHLSILGQSNPVHIPTSHLLEIHPNITHPSTPRSPQWSLSLRFPHQDTILRDRKWISFVVFETTRAVSANLFSRQKATEGSYSFGALHCLQAQRGRSW